MPSPNTNPGGMNNNPVPPNLPFPSMMPGLPNFPPPRQGVPANISISSSEGSIVIPPQNPNIIANKVGMESNKLSEHFNNGNLMHIQSCFPDTNITYNHAGPGQNFLQVVGPPQSANMASAYIRQLDPHSDSSWSFLNDGGDFEQYPPDCSRLIENAFSSGSESIQISNQYTVFFGTNGNPHTQLSRSGYIYRAVRRGSEPIQTHYSSGDIVWNWTDDNMQWQLYEPEASKLIEYYYQNFLKENMNVNFGGMNYGDRANYAKTLSVLVSGTSGFAYMMDFVNMVQINEETRRWRGIRRGNQNAALRVSRAGQEDPIPWIPHPDLH